MDQSSQISHNKQPEAIFNATLAHHAYLQHSKSFISNFEQIWQEKLQEELFQLDISLSDQSAAKHLLPQQNSLLSATLVKIPDPIVYFNKADLSVKIDFQLEGLQSLSVKYHPQSQSVSVEIIAPKETIHLLQAQLPQLEAQLATHNLKLHNISLKTVPPKKKSPQQKKIKPSTPATR